MSTIRYRVTRLACTCILFATMVSPGYGQMIVGHRGASYDAPENTLSAFREAWNQDADGVEGDFYFTDDNQVVCIHDRDTKRTGGKKMSVSGSTLEQLRTLEYGSWKSSKFEGEPLPTLAEVCRVVPEEKTFVIELKTGPEIVPLMKQILEAEKFDLSRVLVISFDADTVAKSKELLPDVRAHWLTGYKRDPITRTVRPSVDVIAKTLKQCHADGLGTKGDRSVVTADFVQTLKHSGMKEFHVWTIDDPQDAKYFQELGAVGITTNRPAFIREQLAE